MVDAKTIEVTTSLEDYLSDIKRGQDDGFRENNRQFAEVRALVANKADKSDVAALRSDIQDHGRRLTQLEDDAHDEAIREETHNNIHTQSRLSRKGRWAVIAAAITLIAGVALDVISVLHH